MAMNAYEYADKVAAEGGVPCEYGHLSCALMKGGPCMDELLSNAEAKERREALIIDCGYAAYAAEEDHDAGA